MTVWWFATLKAEQLDEVLEIEQASFQRPWNRRAFEDEFACRDAVHYAVLSPGSRRIIGYLFVRAMSSEMHLLKIAVAPRWRRCGVAAWALRQCFEKARSRGFERMVLEVRATNRAAIGLYVKLGFSKIGTRSRYYADTGEDALVMAKLLES
ncbi:MAG: hypothetical protein AMJ54_11535 [Deltaproteobacteria bacterium SG8_13]|nr:MAG: hypothetical protein AMJ54_11535 [Deltaproteobacteria bacterium SG8_13]